MEASIELIRMNTVWRKKAWLKKFALAIAGSAMLFSTCAAQQQAQGAPAQKLPDAPRPQPNLPKTTPVEQPQPDAAQPNAPGTPRPEPPATLQPYQPQPQSQTQASQNASDKLYTIITTVNAVVVPVVVKDRDGNLVQDLDKSDFTILENGVKQSISFFSSDPFPISAAVVIDADLSPSAFDKIKKTLPALVGAFGQFDEVAMWIYGDSFKKVQDFTALKSGSELDGTVEELRSLQGVAPEPAVGAGPMGSPPVINGRPVDVRNQNINIYNNPQTVQASRATAKVLNDVMLAAAQDLSKRHPEHHRIVFVISDGRESGSNTGFADVVKVLNSQHITVFGVDLTAAPILGRLQRLPIPKVGGANVLSRYASATGGDTFNDFSVRSIEDAYSQLTQEARNQYTLAYNSRAGVLQYRDIDIRVSRPGCRLHPGNPGCVWVYAREGFYPLPPSR
jgi:VWFA-related protein